ncbi:hypothetical protein ACJX0J_016531, partial [Zea mays]
MILFFSCEAIFATNFIQDQSIVEHIPYLPLSGCLVVSCDKEENFLLVLICHRYLNIHIILLEDIIVKKNICHLYGVYI